MSGQATVYNFKLLENGSHKLMEADNAPGIKLLESSTNSSLTDTNALTQGTDAWVLTQELDPDVLEE